MCGICGVIGIARTEQAEAVTRRMMEALRHRGPDEDGLLVAPSVALGMRRLSIIDLSGGRQPVFNEAGNVAVVYNGEIYNYRQLRGTLEGRGHVFGTHSDTEVIVHAYEEWGEECLRELRGMFAFALWDARVSGTSGDAARHARIFLARDRLGIKPLYYSYANGVFLFASEVRALMASGYIAPRVAADSLEAYLLFGSVAEPSTIVEGVFSLPPGHSITLQADAPSASLHPKRYWDFSDAALQKDSSRPRNFIDAAKQLRSLLEETVRDHLMADVPLGVFLSSGLDSTALVALASRCQSDLRTFTVVFPEQRFSESRISRETAKHFKTNHQEVLLAPEQVLDQLDEAVNALDQPTMDGLNTYFVSRAAHLAGLKVALSGLGGDELFGGYSTFTNTSRAALVAGLGRWVPGPLRRLTAGVAVKIAAGEAVRKAAAAWRSPEDFPHAYYFTRLLFTPFRMRRLLAPYFESVAKRENGNEVAPLWRQRMRETTRQARRLDSFNCVSGFELQTYMVNTLLRDTDAVSMANSLEVRVPLLDHRLVEFVARLPKRMKYIAGVPKALLVEALSDVLPDIVVGQAKRTFTFPWERWLRGALRAQVAAGLADLAPALQPVLNREAVEAVWHDFLAGRTSWARPWSLYVLNQWCSRHLESGGADAEVIPPTAAAGHRH